MTVSWLGRVAVRFGRITAVLLWLLPGTSATGVLAAQDCVGTAIPSHCVCTALNGITAEIVAWPAGRIEAVMRERAGDGSQPACGGLVLAYIAKLLYVYGRWEEAEGYAERSLSRLEKTRPAGDPELMEPLRILTVTRFQKGQLAKARAALERMRRVQTERAEDRATTHVIAGDLLLAGGRLGEAEREYSRAVAALDEAGKSGSGDSGAVLLRLGSLYIRQHRFVEARAALLRCRRIADRTDDLGPIDRVTLLAFEADLEVREGRWPAAGGHLQQAITATEALAHPDPGLMAQLLGQYGAVLRKLHRGREARSVEARAAALRGPDASKALVDVTELRRKPD